MSIFANIHHYSTIDQVFRAFKMKNVLKSFSDSYKKLKLMLLNSLGNVMNSKSVENMIEEDKVSSF